MSLIKGGAASKLLRAVSLMALLAARPSFALVPVTNLTNGSSIDFSDLVGPNALSVQIGDKLFSNFALNPTNVAVGELSLSALSNQVGFGFSIQLTGFDAVGFGSKDIRLFFTAKVTNPFNLISGIDLSITGGVSGWGDANVAESVYTNGFGAGKIASLFADINPASTSPYGEGYISFPSPQPMVWIEKDISVSGNAGQNPGDNPLGDTATISIIDQTFAQIPEPSTLFLLAAGVAGLLVLRRRK
jgi:hypothetical protein